MVKLTKDQKRKKKLAQRKKSSTNVAPKKPVVDMNSENLTYFSADKDGNKTEKTYEVKVEKAEVLYCEERLINGKIAQVKADRKIDAVAWDYFGVAGSNFIHPGIEECDGLRVFITPNEMEGVVVAFPDWAKEEFFDTTGFVIFTEVDTEFNFEDVDSIQQIEKNVNENILPIIANHSHVESIEPQFIFRSYSIFKAFDKHWSASFFVAKSKLKKFERDGTKKNIERDFLNRSTVSDIITKH